MAKNKAKLLEDIRGKVSALLEEETKIKQDLVAELSEFMIAAQVFSIDFDVLLGGILSVVHTAQKTGKLIRKEEEEEEEEEKEKNKIREEWKKSGETFRRQLGKQRIKKNPHPDSQEDSQDQNLAKEAA